MFMKNKRGQVGSLPGFITTLVVVGVVLGIGLVILAQLMSNLVTGGYSTDAVDAVNATLRGIDDFAVWIPLIVLGIAGSIVLAIILSGLLRNR